MIQSIVELFRKMLTIDTMIRPKSAIIKYVPHLVRSCEVK